MPMLLKGNLDGLKKRERRAPALSVERAVEEVVEESSGRGGEGKTTSHPRRKRQPTTH